VGEIANMGFMRAGSLVKRELLGSAIRGSGVDNNGSYSKLDSLVNFVHPVGVAHYADGVRILTGTLDMI